MSVYFIVSWMERFPGYVKQVLNVEGILNDGSFNLD